VGIFVYRIAQDRVRDAADDRGLGDRHEFARLGAQRRETQDEPVYPAHQRTVSDQRANPFGLVSCELHEADPAHHNHQAVAGQLAANRLDSQTQRILVVKSLCSDLPSITAMPCVSLLAAMIACSFQSFRLVGPSVLDVFV
jgi:hypothetical protein